jgi:hypothetical protein
VRQVEAASRAPPSTGLYFRPGGQSLTAASATSRSADSCLLIIMNRIRGRVPPQSERLSTGVRWVSPTPPEVLSAKSFAEMPAADARLQRKSKVGSQFGKIRLYPKPMLCSTC